MIVNNKQKNKGFTVVELLVVISIMVILGAIFTNILIDTLRGRNKVRAINQVKQNGQVVLDKLSNEIRNADGVVCVDKYIAAGANPGSVKDTIVIVNGGVYTQYRFIAAPSSSVNGKIQKLNFTEKDIPTTSESLTRIPDANLCIDQSDSLNGGGSNLQQSLTDTDPINGVSIIYNQVNGIDQDVFEQRDDNIIIKFNASAGVQAGSAYDVTVAEGGIPFSTSIQVRGIRK